MRRTIGISVAVLVISTSAMAAPRDKAASHHPDRPDGAKPHQAAHRTGKAHISLKSDPRARSAHQGATPRHQFAAAHVASYDSAGAPDSYSAPRHRSGAREIGKAAWYNHVGSHTANGERLDTVTATAAHRTLPLASYARVTNLDSRRSVIVRINDRGPWTRRFIIDLSPRAADELGMRRAGVVAVAVEPIAGPADSAGTTVATFRSSGTFVTQ
jgi:rare lipoprotein A